MGKRGGLKSFAVAVGLMIMIVVEAYAPKRLAAAAEALASAFVTNPLPLSAFGPDRLDRNRFFFRVGLRRMFTGSALLPARRGATLGFLSFFTSPPFPSPPA